MSIGNTNFITLDSIAEIQDIVNGDYLFTVSNGVIYKLDFQNLILTPDNVDFYTTIESLSAQVISLTNAFSAVNSQMNTLSSLDGVGTLVHEMSAGWTSTNSQVQTLSASTWLPGGAQAIQSGSLLSYVGGANAWESLAPGLEGDSLRIVNNVPQFTGSSAAYRNITNQSQTYHVNTSNDYVEVVPVISATTGGQNYSYIGVTWNVNFNGGQGVGPTINKSALLIEYNDSRASQIITGGRAQIKGGTQGNGEPINFTVIPQADFGNITGIPVWQKPNSTKALGEFSALGVSDNIPTMRPFNQDPVIIKNVLTSQFDDISTYLGGNPAGVPSKWTYNSTYAPDGGKTPVLWISAETSLRVYGTEA